MPENDTTTPTEPAKAVAKKCGHCKKPVDTAVKHGAGSRGCVWHFNCIPRAQRARRRRKLRRRVLRKLREAGVRV